MPRAMIVLVLLGSLRAAHADRGEPAGAEVPRWHRTLSLGALAGVHAASYAWSYLAWYRGRDLRDHLALADEGWFGAGTYAGGADKLGHGMPIDPEAPREQRLFVGVSLNLQALLREHAWASPIGRREVSWRRAADWTSEVVTVPYTTLRVLDLERARER